MATISHDTYEILLNKIGYWLLNNKRSFKKRNIYEYQGRTADLGTVEKAILSRGTNQGADGLTGRYVEAGIVDNSNKDFLPNYVTYNNVKYMKANVVNMVERVLRYESSHGQIPLTVNTEIVNLNNTVASSGLRSYMASQGCSGMGQCTGYYCACNSLQQCFYRLTGILVSESTIASWAGTTSNGTSHQGIETAVAVFNKKYNANIKITWKSFSEVGFDKLQSYIDKGACFFHLLYRNQYGHYEVPQKVSGNNIVVLNSLGNRCNSPAYCGYIENRSQTTQRQYINGISQKSLCILTK